MGIEKRVTREYRVLCDHCGDATMYFTNKTAAVLAAGVLGIERRLAWGHRRLTLCRDCAKKEADGE